MWHLCGRCRVNARGTSGDILPPSSGKTWLRQHCCGSAAAPCMGAHRAGLPRVALLSDNVPNVGPCRSMVLSDWGYTAPMAASLCDAKGYSSPMAVPYMLLLTQALASCGVDASSRAIGLQHPQSMHKTT
ncbi:hypothetical protein L7F22_039710 [Adiantum nelumboides]|nr:hypothetical protein [Adiantum nelumboides]